jgi:hypothetical protein
MPADHRIEALCVQVAAENRSDIENRQAATDIAKATMAEVHRREVVARLLQDGH